MLCEVCGEADPLAGVGSFVKLDP